MESNIGVIIQARTGSTRFPNKVLELLGDKPLIGYVIVIGKKIARKVVLAAPISDDGKFNEICKEYGIEVIYDRCHEDNDVAGRFIVAAHTFGIEVIVRLCGDAPFLSPFIVRSTVKMHMARKADYTVTKGFPEGMNAEVFNISALEKFYPLMNNEEKEHVTLYFERHAKDIQTNIFWFNKMSIDTPEDLENAQKWIKLL